MAGLAAGLEKRPFPPCASWPRWPIAALGRSARRTPTVLALAIAGLLLQIPCVYLGTSRCNYLCDIVRHPEALWSWSRLALPPADRGPGT